MKRAILLLSLGFVVISRPAPGQDGTVRDALKKALTFHVSFDGTADADLALGDRKVYTSATASLRDAREGITAPEISVVKGEGKYGDALRFSKKIKPVLVWRAEKNVAHALDRFEGTVSFWMSLDPEKDLEPGYCDPIQLTDKKWDDACFFVDFDKEGQPRHFRLGVFSNFAEWNPDKKKFDSIPYDDRPWVVVKRHPFAKGKWTHVCFTWHGFNTGKDDGAARLYLNGELQGEQKGKKTYSWDLAKAFLLLGYNYVGLYDDLSVFNRPLTAEEVRALGGLEGGIAALRK